MEKILAINTFNADELWDLLIEMCREIPQYHDLNQKKFLKMIGQFKEEGNAKILMDSEGKGFLLAVKYPDIVQGGFWAWCLMWFVKKEFRCQGIGSKLLDEFIKWGKESGCKHLRIDHLLTRDKYAISKKFIEKGFKPMEVHYYMEVR